MKKTALIVIGLCLLADSTLAGFRIELKGSYFQSENKIFREVYGSAFKPGLEVGLTIVKNLSIWAGVDYFQKSGGLTVTEEETKVWLMPVSAGLRYEIPAGEKLLLHVAAGVQEVFFKEDSSLGTTKKNALGFIVKGGLIFRLTSALGIDLFAGWSTSSMKNGDVEFKVGGLDLGGGLNIRF
ncbi:MAG: hypothetical protein PHI34_03350 [Acidobacteriota bacterium]|nr:hypothetical protein [Acidobacteriota bacterium]